MITLRPSDCRVLYALRSYEQGLTRHQLAVITGLTARTCRQAVYRLRLAWHRIGADRVFRVRETA